MALARDDAWLYCRKSNVTIDKASIADQEERGREACEANGWRLAGVLSEEISASRYTRKERDDWPVLLGHVQASRAAVIILWSSSRGDRKLSEWAQFLDLCHDKGVRIHVLSDERTYNPANKADWKVLATQGVDNDYYSRNLSVEVRRGKRRAMSMGRPASPVPYGYKVHYNPDTSKSAGWKIVSGKAEVARDIIKRVGRHEPIHGIIRELAARGILSPMGRPEWTRGEIRKLATNPAYAGLVRLHDGRYAARQPQADGAEWPPIVTRAEWEAACAATMSRMTGARPNAARHLLSGIAKCECGAWLRAHKKTGYECRNSDMHVLRQSLDEWVRDVICETLSRDDARDLFIRDDSPRISVLESELRELRERRSGFRKKAALGKISEDALEEIESELNPEIEQREREIGTVRRVPALAEAVSADDVRVWWDEATVQARREVIAALTSVTVRKAASRTKAARLDWETRVVFDWIPQAPKRGPGGYMKRPK